MPKPKTKPLNPNIIIFLGLTLILVLVIIISFFIPILNSTRTSVYFPLPKESKTPSDNTSFPMTFDCSCITNHGSVIRDTFTIQLDDWSYIPDQNEMKDICTNNCLMMSEDWPGFDEDEEDIEGSIPTIPPA